MTTSTYPPLAIRRALVGDALHLILMPTERCNFRCVYCFESFEHGRMGAPVVEGLCRLLATRAPDLRSLAIEWFGGEPLLALTVIEQVQRHVLDLGRANPRLRFRGSMTTNGFLLDREVLALLVRLGVTSYQISLDGVAPEHDARRRRADGSGSFARIWAHLLAARGSELPFRIRVRVHVDRDNRTALPGFLETLAAEFAGDERFEVFLRPVARLGGPHDAGFPFLTESETGIVDELRQQATALGLRQFVPDEAEPCYAAAANSFVIRSTGRISKCTVALHHPANDLGQLHADGTASVDDAKMSGWVRGLFSGDREALDCPMKGFAEGPADVGRLPVLPSRPALRTRFQPRPSDRRKFVFE